MNSHDEELLIVLAHRHFDGTLSADDAAQLNRLLAADPAAADVFVRCAMLEGALDRHHADEREDTQAAGFLAGLRLPCNSDSQSATDCPAIPSFEDEPDCPIANPSASTSWPSMMFFALGALATLAGIGAWQWSQPNPQHAQSGSAAPHVAQANPPLVAPVAYLTQANGCA